MNEKSNGLSDKVDAAFQATTTTVVERAKWTGTPVIIWENGRIREVPSDRFELPTEESSAKKSTS